MQIGTKIGTKTISVNCKTVYKSMVFLLEEEMAEGKGFEPPKEFLLQRFSKRRLQPLATPPPGPQDHADQTPACRVENTRRMQLFLAAIWLAVKSENTSPTLFTLVAPYQQATPVSQPKVE